MILVISINVQWMVQLMMEHCMNLKLQYHYPHTVGRIGHSLLYISGDYVIVTLVFVTVSYSHKGQHLLTGMDNGVIRIHPLTTASTANVYYISESLQELQWSISIHDNDIGRVNILSYFHLLVMPSINRSLG